MPSLYLVQELVRSHSYPGSDTAAVHGQLLTHIFTVGRDGKVADYLIFNVAGKWHHFKRIPSEGEDEQSPVFHSSKSKSNESDKQDK